MLNWRGRLLAVAGAALVSAAFAAGPVAAQQAKIPAPLIIVVDSQEVVTASAAGKSILAQRDKYAQQFQAEVEKEKKALAESEADLGRQRSVLSPDAFSQKAKELQQRFVESQRRMQERGAALDQSLNKALGQLRQAAGKVVSEVAVEYGANLVLQENMVLKHDPAMNVTKLVIERLDRTLPSVEVPAPATAAAPAADKTKKASKK